MTLAMLGFGVQFQIGDGASPEVFTTLEQLVDANTPGLARAPVDATHMGTEARFMLFLSGLRDGGEVPLVFHYSSETYDVLLEEYLNDALRHYRVIGPDGFYWDFHGLVTKLESEPPIDDVWEINVTIKVSGKPTFNAPPPPPPPEMPESFAIYLNAADTLTNGAVLPNRLAADPTNVDENILLYDTGYMPNRGAGTAVVHGTDGEWVLWEAANTGDTYSWWTGDTPPAHAYGIRFEVKSKAGLGAQNIRYGTTAALQTLAITEAPQTVNFNFTATGITTNYNTFGVRGDGTNTPKIMVRRVILQATGGAGQPANAAAMPVWASLKRGSGDARKELAWPNGLPKSGNYLDNTGNLARVAIRDPDHTTGNDYRNIGASGVTLIVAATLETGGTSSSAIGADVNAVNGVTATTLGIGTGGTSFVAHSPGTIGVGSSGWLRAAIEDEGLQFLCIRVENLQQIASFHEIDFNWDTDAFSMSGNVWRLGGNSSASTWKGKIRAAAIAFDFVSEADKVEAMAKMAYDIAAEGDTVDDFDFAMFYGDSRLGTEIPSTTRLITQVSVDGHYSGERNLFTYQFASGGETLAIVATEMAQMTIMARQMVYRGRKGIITGLLGTNDYTLMVADPAAYLASQVSTIFAPMDALDDSEGLYFAPFNEIVRYQAGWNAAVAVFEAGMDAGTGRNTNPGQTFNDVVDSQSSVVGLSNLTAINANPSTWFLENPSYVHPNATGNSALVVVFDAMVGRYRTWKAG